MSKKLEYQLLLPIINEPKVPRCACGCGIETKWNKQHKRFNIFINHHHWNASESKEALSKRMTELCNDPANREALSKRMIKFFSDPVNREAQSKKRTAFFSDPSNRESLSKRMIKIWNDPAKREALSKKNTEFYNDPAQRETISKRSVEYWNDPSKRETQSKRATAQWQTQEFRAKQSKIHAELWKSPEFRDKVLKAISKVPNKPETILNQLTPIEVRYVGNRSFWVRIKLLVDGEYVIKNKNPDFKITGQKKVIELYGDYWHKNDNPEDIINAYKEIGYDCLIIWESEIYNELELTLERISQFMDKKSWQMTLL
jgi:very-short-patch-repair endonuclease